MEELTGQRRCSKRQRKLIYKMQINYGVHGKLMNLTYLGNRMQAPQARISNAKSEEATEECMSNRAVNLEKNNCTIVFDKAFDSKSKICNENDNEG